MKHEFTEFKKKSIEETNALRQEQIRLKRRMEVEDKGKKKEATKNVVSVHKISSQVHTINENEGESGYNTTPKTRGETNTSLTVERAR